MLGGGAGTAVPASGSVRPVGPGSGGGQGSGHPSQPFSRHSNGLDQFFGTLRDRGTLSLLDFAGATQDNISFITSMGHRLASEDFSRSLEMTFGRDMLLQNQQEPTLVDQFVSENLLFERDSFDGVLLWDSLQLLSPHLLQVTIDRLYESMRPESVALAFFNADEKAKQIPIYSWRLVDANTVVVTLRGHHPAGQYFNNRTLEKMFHRFSSVKFFLARDHLREIIVRR